MTKITPTNKMPKELRDAIKVVNRYGYVVFIKKGTSNTTQKVMSALSDKPIDLHSLCAKVYDREYSTAEYDRVYACLVRLRAKGLVVHDGDTFRNSIWISKWRLA